MRDLLDMDYADIAELLDVNESTLRWQVAEGRKQLRRLLSPLT
jgi:DNA-directed RNA polymerase specialized sigma24 family protein